MILIDLYLRTHIHIYQGISYIVLYIYILYIFEAIFISLID